MQICTRLESILSDRDHPIRVIITNVLRESDRVLFATFDLLPSRVDGNKTYVGSLRPSEINLLKAIIDDRAKIEVEPGVPRSQH